jgi:hypothetical protein
MKHSIKSVALSFALVLGSGVASASSASVLGLDSPWTCSAGSPIANTADKTQGSASVKFRDAGYSLCSSPKIACNDLSLVSNEILFDVKLPQNLPNPWWVGDLSLYIEVPSANVYNAWVGRTDLTGLPTNQWVTVSIPATQEMVSALSGNCTDAIWRFAVNTSAPGVLVDNIRFAGDVVTPTPVSQELTITADGDDGQFDPSTSVIPAGWGPQGEYGNVLYAGSYSIQDWGGLGGGVTPSVFRFTLNHAIPAGTTIVDAALALYGWGTWDWDETSDSLQIAIEYSDDAEQISGLSDLPFTVGGRDLLPTTVRWPETGGLAWQYDAWHTSPNLAGLLQELVDTVGGLSAGAHVQFYVYGTTPDINSEVIIEDSSHPAGHAPKLTIIVE